jgi:hypothetical protein
MTSDQKTYPPNRQRILPCGMQVTAAKMIDADKEETTWNDAPVLASRELDYYILLCEAIPCIKDFTVNWDLESNISFDVFPAHKDSIRKEPVHSVLPRSLIYSVPLKDDEAFLFHHHTNHVADIIMPYENERNPWKCAFPSAELYHMSRGHDPLYKAIFAQAVILLFASIARSRC